MRNPPLRHRLVLAACVAVATALALVSAAFYIVLQHRLDHDANDTLRSRSQAALATVTVKRGRLAVGEGPRDALLDQRVWVFAGAREVRAVGRTGYLDQPLRAAADSADLLSNGGTRGGQSWFTASADTRTSSTRSG